MFTSHQIFCVLVVAATAQMALSSAGADADCGSRVVKEVNVGGENVTSEQPWLISIFKRTNSTSTDWYYKLSGTLITTKHVVTSAPGLAYGPNYTAAYPASQLRLIAGTLLQTYGNEDPKAQSRNVTSVIIREQRGFIKRINNVALLVAEHSFDLTWNVNFACVDWSGLLQAPTPDQSVLTHGWRMGWDTPSAVYTTQPSVIASYKDCLTTGIVQIRPLSCRITARLNSSDIAKQKLCDTMASFFMRSYLSFDDICAKTTSDNICGSNGGGLLVERTTSRGARFFLVGVLRDNLAWTDAYGCHDDQYYAYTSLASHTRWIKRQIRGLRKFTRLSALIT